MQGSFPQAGFFYQNHIAALKLLEMLEFGSALRSITLENYSKGNHIDDIIIEYGYATHYYQVKWSADDNTPYTIHNLITPQKDKAKPLIKELAEGYSRLSDRENIEIILFSTKQASNKKRPKGGITRSLAEVLEHIHIPFTISSTYKSLADLPNLPEYESVMEKLRIASGLDHQTFEHFFKRLRFMLGQGSRDTQKENVIHKMEVLGIERHLYETLLVAAVEWSISGKEVRADDVLERLGLANRFVDRITHDFKVEEQYFIDNPRLFAQLDNAIESLPGGFVLLEGPPGSGKSTYLTEYRKQRANVKFAYYCFVPDEIALGNPRLEKDTFLKSLCLGIKNSFPDLDLPEPYSQEYEGKLLKWLYHLSDIGEKVIFIIDGLDHVDKKKDDLKQPLTSYLDGDLPPNVFFILSSQYPEAISYGIRTQLLRDQRRHIKIARFSEGETQQFLERRGLRPSLKIVALAADKSEGIPLYLYYITMMLMEAPANEYHHEKLLQELPYLENGRIDTYHELLYQQVSRDALAVRTLALLANRREFTSSTTLVELLHLLGTQTDVLQVETVCAKYQHLLRRTDVKGYTIFHNSFREFILRKTEPLIGPINDALVSYYRNNPNNDETYRNFYRHLFELGRYQEILSDCNEQWLIRSWQAFRPFEEISSNLDLAWDAAARILSLKEFVRVAFLEQRFGRASFNFEYTENYKQSKFLLNINKYEEAIRRVWDGERVRVSAADFYEFVLEYFKKTGHPLPQRIVEVRFTQFRRRTNLGETTARFEARALYEDWRILFAEVTDYEWRTSDEHTHAVTLASPDENERTNNSIKRQITDVLFSAKNYHGLVEITQEPSCHPSVKSHAALRTSELLLQAGELNEAVRFIDLIDFALINRVVYNRLLIEFAEANSYQRVTSNVPTKYPPPELFQGLIIDKPDYTLKDELLRLYDDLRVCFLQKSADASAYEIKADSFNVPERNFFKAIIDLSALWSESVQEGVPAAEKSRRIKRILNELNVDRELIRRAFQDTFNDAYFVGRGVHQIYAHIFSFVAKNISTSYMDDLVSYWLQLDEGLHGFKNQHSSLGFAKFLHALLESDLRPAILRLLKRAEAQARLDEETLTLMSNLVECAEGYGHCGFDTEAKRLWDELYILACGVYSRKDYQFSEAIYALERAHKYHPENSSKRLGTLLTLAHQLRGAADDRAVARAIGDLIDFSIEISPALAIELLDKEERSIFRGEVIEAISKTLAKRADIKLRYVWALVRTMDKWENFRDYNDNTYPAMLKFFVVCLQRKDWELAQEIYEYARHQLLVEKEMPQRVYEFAKEATTRGAALSFTDEDYITFKTDWDREQELKARNEQNRSHIPRRSRERRIKQPSLDELHNLAEEDFGKFQALLDKISEQYFHASRTDDLKHAYSTLKDALLKVLPLKPPGRPAHVEISPLTNIRYFVEFKRGVLGLRGQSEFEYKRQVEQLFETLLVNVCQPLLGEEWHDLVEGKFDYKEWLNKFTERTYRPILGFRLDVLDKRLPQLVEQSSLANLRNWEEFCRHHLFGYDLTTALLSIAIRIKNIDKNHSLELLQEAFNSNKDFFYDYGRRATNPFLNLLFELDPQRAKEVLLDGFSHQYRQNPKDIIYHLDQVLEYADCFGEPEIYEFTYTEYEEYNARLAEGLTKKETDLEWIEEFKPEQHFEFAVVQYLLRLFNYPEVEIRKLSLASLFDLIKFDNRLLSAAFTYCQAAQENVKEHFLSLVYSIALYDHSLVFTFKDHLFASLETPHFNIRQSAKEILLYCVERGSALTRGEMRKLEITNVKPQLMIPSVIEGTLQKGRKFIPCSYQTNVLHELFTYHADDNLTDKVYTRLLQLGWTSTSWMQQESAVHRAHNINANFDTIEINGPYFQAVQKVLNEVFVKEIEEQKYEDADIDTLKYEFRLYDPSDLFVQRVKRSQNVNWLGPATTQDDFLEFNDIEQRLSSFIARDDEWITLYEDGSQRTGNDYDRSGASSTYFNVIAFLADKSVVQEVGKLFSTYAPTPYFMTKNRYRHEIPNLFPAGSSYPTDKIKPIIGISRNLFRGQQELSIAALLPDFLEELGLSREDSSSLNFHKNGERLVEFISWQEAYDQDRRRQKPVSAGVLLKVRKSLLESYLHSHNYQLCFIVSSKRTTDKYVPEEKMNWRSIQRIFTHEPEQGIKFIKMPH
jgi:hypothetical protein